MQFALLVLVTLMLGACSDICANTVVSQAAAPGGKVSAVMFQRDCGATTGYSTQVSVLETGQQPSGAGNAFVADDNHGSADAAKWGGPWADMKWLGPDRLLIRYDGRSRIFTQQDAVSGVQISYEAVSP